MGHPAIKVEHLSKRYRIGAAKNRDRSLRDALTDTMAAPVRRLRGGRNGSRNAEDFWALKDVSFEVQPGEVVGIIGRNGAGKSTLLKILSRITKPTSGRIEIRGRVASLLEVGTGFHPDLTGRENVYLNGAILGMKRREIERKFDEIVAFAEVERFIDTPVKRYSSGMYLRLAFAVAAHLEPEILVIDEVLAVGDYQFQQKCLKQISRVVGAGRTVVLVSHNLAVLGETARLATWLNQGSLRAFGSVESVIREYVSSGCSATGEWSLDTTPCDKEAYVRWVRVIQNSNIATGNISIDSPFEIEFTYTIKSKLPFCRIGFELSSATGAVLFSSAEPDDPSLSPINRMPGTYSSRCTLPGWFLAPGAYFITPHVDDLPVRRHFTAEHACNFEVVENALRGVAHQGRPGILAPKLPWSQVA